MKNLIFVRLSVALCISFASANAHGTFRNYVGTATACSLSGINACKAAEKEAKKLCFLENWATCKVIDKGITATDPAGPFDDECMFVYKTCQVVVRGTNN